MKRTKRFELIVMLGLFAAAAPVASAMAQQAQPAQPAQPGQSAQRDTGKKAVAVPADARPPKGMCRIWIDGVPAAQQPAATDCATAVKNRPANGRVIFGDDFADSAKTKSADKTKLPPDAKGFTGVKPPTQLLPKRPPE